MRSKTFRRDLELAISAPWLLSTQSSREGRGGQRVLLHWNHPLLPPAWQLTLTGTHSLEASFLWLAAKETLQRVTDHEKLLLSALAAETDQQTQLLLLLRRNKEILRKVSLKPVGNSNLIDRPVTQLKRILNGFAPKFGICKEFRNQNLPPVRRIGVGYKDKGSLSTALSWRDQMVLTEEVMQQPESEILLMKSVLSFLEFLSTRRENQTPPADETQSRSKRKDRK